MVVFGYPACEREACDHVTCAAALASLVAYGRVVVPDRTTIAVLAPTAPPGDSVFGQWLRDFAEGLGLSAFTVVAPYGLAPELYAFASRNPGQVQRIVLIGAPSIGEGTPGLLRSPGEYDVVVVEDWAGVPAAIAMGGSHSHRG